MPLSAVPPPLFRPGPHTPQPKASAMIKEARQLNTSEKEDLYRTFGVVLQQYGPLETTDSRLLSVFMGLSPWMRQGIKYLGGLKDFFRQADIFKIDGDVVSLAWQEEEESEQTKPSSNNMSSKPKTSSQARPAHPGQCKNSESETKPLPKNPAKQSTQDSTSSGTSSEDESWEGEEEESGWWLLDPLPGEEEEWKLATPLQGRMGGGYYDDFKKLEEKDNKDPEESQRKLVMTSTPALSSPEDQLGSGEKKTTRTTPEKESPTLVPITWEESAIAQEVEAETRQESQQFPDASKNDTSRQSWVGDSRANNAKTTFSDMEGSLATRERPSEVECDNKKFDGTGEGKQYGTAEGSQKEDAEEDWGDEVDDDDDDKDGGREEEMMYRSGSLHQAEDDVILVEVVEEDSSADDDVNNNGNRDGNVLSEDLSDIPVSDVDFEGDVKETGVIEEGRAEAWYSADDKGGDGERSSEDAADSVEKKEKEEEKEDVTKGDGNHVAQDVVQDTMNDRGKDVAQAVAKAVVEAVVGNAVKDVGLSRVISKLDSVSITDPSPTEGGSQRNGSLAEVSQDSSSVGETDVCSDEKMNIKQELKGEMGNEMAISEKKASPPRPKPVLKSVGMVTDKPRQSHKSICTKEVRTRSCKVNTMVRLTISKGVETGEDPRVEELKTELARETQKTRALTSDVENLNDKLFVQNNKHASDSKDTKRKLDQTMRELEEARRKLQSKGVMQVSELRKSTAELKDAESRLNAAISKIGRAEKENCNLTRELEKTTRQLLDLEKSRAEKPQNRERSTSTGGLELERDPAAEEEKKLMKMRARSAEQKVLELQYQYAMQSLNKALQESQYVFRMYGNNLLSSSHREMLRMKWMDYQMYIKEKTDEVATANYSALKTLQQDVPLADIPSLKAQRIETFNPFKSPTKQFQFLSEAGPSDDAADPTLTGVLGQAGVGPSVDLFASSFAANYNADATAQALNAAAAAAAAASTAGIPSAPGLSQAPPGLSGAGASALPQGPPGLTNQQVTGSDLSMPTFLQAQTQRSAPGKVMRRVPRKAPKAFLATNFMSSLQHTTKVYGAPTSAGAPLAPTFGQRVGMPMAGITKGGAVDKQSLVHDWMDTESPTPNQGSQFDTPMDTAISNNRAQAQPERMDVAQSSINATEQLVIPPHSRRVWPTGIGRGRAISPAGMVPPPLPSMETQRGGIEATELARALNQKPAASSDVSEVTPSLNGSISIASSCYTSRSASPLVSLKDGAQDPAGTKLSFPARAPAAEPGSSESQGKFFTTGKPSTSSMVRPSSAGDAGTFARAATNQPNAQSEAKTRSISLGGTAIHQPTATSRAMTSGANTPSNNQSQAFTKKGFPKITAPSPDQAAAPMSAPYTQGSGVPSRLKARQTRMPYHRGAEAGAGAGSMMEPADASGSGSSGDRWTTQVSKRKRKAMNLVDQQTQLMKEYGHLTRSRDASPTKLASMGSSSAVGEKARSKNQSSLDKLVSYLAKQFKHMTRKEMTDAILQVRLDHKGSLSGIPMRTIISEASNYLTRSEKQKQRKASGTVTPLCAVCQDDLEGHFSDRKLDCGHRFHNNCIKTWVSEEGTCPICRKHTLFAEDFPRLN